MNTTMKTAAAGGALIAACAACCAVSIVPTIALGTGLAAVGGAAAAWGGAALLLAVPIVGIYYSSRRSKAVASLAPTASSAIAGGCGCGRPALCPLRAGCRRKTPQGDRLMYRRTFLSAIGAVALVSAASFGWATSLIPGFDDAAKADVPVLVHVTAPWCETCQAQKPIVSELLAKPDFAAMKKFDIDFDSQKDILADLRVTTQSTMIVFRDGKEIDRQVGQTDPAEIDAFLRKALK
jgi:thioredoxin 1